MTSKIKVDNINKVSDDSNIIKKCGTTTTIGSGASNPIVVDGSTVTLGRCGGTVALASGATQTGFGRTGTVDWQTGSIKTATFTAANGEGYFANTTGSAFNMNLPAGSAGAIVSVADYAETFDSNNLTVVPNGSDKIGSVAASAILSTKGQSVTFVYVDGTQGWVNTMDSTSNVRGVPPYIVATGGTITTVCTNFKVHTFTGPGTFTVTNAGGPGGSETVSYLVVAGGGGAGYYYGGAGGAGGFRESKAATDSYTASPLNATSGPTYNLPVSVQAYPITIGAGGPAMPNAGPPGRAPTGAPSTFSTITSTGGGGGSGGSGPGYDAGPGGSGGGGGGASLSDGGTGNTPPVAPPQGNAGSPNSPGANRGAGGGGAGEAGGTDGTNYGGDGVTTSINGTPTAFAGGGGGSNPNAPGGDGGGGNGGGTAGTANTGGGQGGCAYQNGGGSGVVIIRYRFQ